MLYVVCAAHVIRIVIRYGPVAVVQPAIESGRWVLSIDSIGNVPAPAGPGGAAGAQNGFGHMVWVCTEDAVSPMTPKASVFVPQNYALCSAGQVSGTGSRAPGGHGSFDDGDVMAIELDKDGQVQFFKNGEKFGEKVATQAPAAPAPPGTKYVLVISGTPQGGPGQPGPASECVVRLLNPREGQPQPSSEEETTAATLRPRRVRAPFVVCLACVMCLTCVIRWQRAARVGAQRQLQQQTQQALAQAFQGLVGPNANAQVMALRMGGVDDY